MPNAFNHFIHFHIGLEIGCWELIDMPMLSMFATEKLGQNTKSGNYKSYEFITDVKIAGSPSQILAWVVE